jgi:type IV secretory pathway VirB10-like protein
VIPPPPEGLPSPPRSVRSLRIGLIFGLVLTAAAGLAFITLWSLHVIGTQHEQAKNDTQPGPVGQGASMQDLLSNMPTGTEIQRAGQKLPPPTPRPQSEQKQEETKQQPQQQAQAPIDPNMTDTAIAARRTAWQTYYQQLAQAQQDKAKRAREGMAADTDATQKQQTDTPQPPAGLLQQQKQGPTDFLSSVASNPATDYSPFTLTDPLSPYELKAGDIITAKLESGLNSDTQGDIRALVTKHVYDYSTGNYILIPQGSRLFGTYSAGTAYGQTRIMVAWTRIIYPGPCSQSLDLGAMTGSDQTGQAGFSDLTENHYGKIFLNALLVSLFSAGIQLSQPPSSAFQQYNPVQSASGAVGQQMGQLGMEFARKGMDIPPTQRIRQGYQFVVMSHKDIAFSRPWVEGDCRSSDVTVALR